MLTRLRGRRGWVLAVVLLAAFATNLTLTILTIAIPDIADAFDADPGDVGWVSIAPIVVSALLTPTFGRASDMYGRRRVWMLGFSIAIAGMAASALAPTLGLLIAARVLTGVGVAAVFPSGLAIATAAYPAQQRSTPIGLWTSCVAVSPALGVILGGILLESISYRWLFVAQLPVAVFAFVLALLVLTETRSETDGRFDILGAVLGAVVIFGVLLPINKADDWGWTSPLVLGSIAVAALAAPAFVVVERRAAHPVVPFAMLRDRPLALSIAGRALLASIYMGSFIVQPLYLREVLGWGSFAVAMALVPRPAAMGVVGPFVTRFVNALGASRTAITGGICITIAVAGFATVALSPNYPVLLVFLVVQGIGLGMMSSASTTIAANRVDVSELGTMSGLVSISSSVSNSVGMAVMLSIVGLAGGVTSTGAYRVTFGVGLVVCVIGLVFLLRMARTLRREGAGAAGERVPQLVTPSAAPRPEPVV